METFLGLLLSAVAPALGGWLGGKRPDPIGHMLYGWGYKQTRPVTMGLRPIRVLRAPAGPIW